MKHCRLIVVSVVAAGLAELYSLVASSHSVTADERTKHPAPSMTSDHALARLEQGNPRCVEGKSAHECNLSKWSVQFLVKQKAFARVLGCSDSRAPPELPFDQGFSELFVIRVVGNIVDLDVFGSNQYAVEHVAKKLTAVLERQNCGAVTAALAPPDETKNEPLERHKPLERIRLAIESVDHQQEQEQRVAAAAESLRLPTRSRPVTSRSWARCTTSIRERWLSWASERLNRRKDQRNVTT